MREPKHETRARKAKLAISYITFGTLTMVWAVVWLIYLTIPSDISGAVYIASGAVLSGIAVVMIGVKVGDIGKEANRDEEEHEEKHEEEHEEKHETQRTQPSLQERPLKNPSATEVVATEPVPHRT